MMSITCKWGGDLEIGPTGDIAVASVVDNLDEKIIRRLLTNPGDYLWAPNYGGGLAAQIGSPVDLSALQANIRAQMEQEPLISPYPLPSVLVSPTVSYSDDARVVTITYQSTDQNSSRSLSLTT